MEVIIDGVKKSPSTLTDEVLEFNIKNDGIISNIFGKTIVVYTDKYATIKNCKQCTIYVCEGTRAHPDDTVAPREFKFKGLCACTIHGSGNKFIFNKCEMCKIDMDTDDLYINGMEQCHAVIIAGDHVDIRECNSSYLHSECSECKLVNCHMSVFELPFTEDENISEIDCVRCVIADS